MTKKICLLNNFQETTTIDTLGDTYYPRLQVNKHGEIVLAMYKHGSLTTGIFVGKVVKGSKPQWKLGKKFTDWEVVGELVDYDGEVTITFKNEYKKNLSYEERLKQPHTIDLLVAKTNKNRPGYRTEINVNTNQNYND